MGRQLGRSQAARRAQSRRVPPARLRGPVLVIRLQLAPPRSRDATGCQASACRHRWLMAGTVASGRQLTGIINIDDCFKAAKSVDRLSSFDPQLPVGRAKCWL